MSTTQKARDRLLKKPPPKDLRWEELVRVLRSYGFTLVEEGGGSHNYFVLTIGVEIYRIDASRPHPSPIVKVYKIKEIAQKLSDWGLL